MVISSNELRAAGFKLKGLEVLPASFLQHLRDLHVLDCAREEPVCEDLREWVLRRFVLSVDSSDDTECRSRCK